MATTLYGDLKMTWLPKLLCAPAVLALVCACSTDDMSSGAMAVGDRMQDTGSAVAGLATAATTTGNSGYVNNAAAGDMYEIKSSQMAIQRSQNDAVKMFAREMIAAHTATTAELKPIAQMAGITPPMELDARRASMLENLQSASAENFDSRYIDQQTAAHEEALTLHRTYADGGDHAQLKAFASKTAPAVEQHLTHVRGLDRAD